LRIDYPELEKRGFDFRRDYEVINGTRAGVVSMRAKVERLDRAHKEEFLRLAASRFESTLAIDSENVTAHTILV
jgi:hypothetical protein